MGEFVKPAIKVGILGCANIARKVSRAIQLAGSCVELYAIGSRSIAKAQDFAEANNFPSTTKIYGSYDQVLDDESVDAVYIPLPTALHREWVLKAASKGKHILMEKPLSLTNQELDQMLEAVESSGLQLMDGTMWMHHPRAPRMFKELESLGEIQEMQSVFCFPGEVLFPGFLKQNIRVKSGLDALGALGDVGWYCIRGFLWAVNFELPKTVTALPGVKLNESGVITACSARLVWEDGKAATFSCSFHAFMSMQLAIQGTHGTLVIDDFVIPFEDDKARYKVLRGAKFADMDLTWNVENKVVEVANEVPQEVSMVREFARLVGEVKYGGCKPDHKWHTMAKSTQAVVCAVADSVAANCTTITLK